MLYNADPGGSGSDTQLLWVPQQGSIVYILLLRVNMRPVLKLQVLQMDAAVFTEVHTGYLFLLTEEFLLPGAGDLPSKYRNSLGVPLI
jgi:hypothetical protein